MREELRATMARLVPLFLFLFLVLVFAFVSGVFVIASLLVPTSFLIAQMLFYFSPAIVDGIHISGIGFIIPALLTLLFIVVLYPPLTSRILTKNQFQRATLVLIGLTIVSIGLALFLPGDLLPKSEGGTDFVLTLSLSGFLGYMFWKGEGNLALRWSFPLGFAIGLVSDFESLRFIQSGAFGGNGFFDGDFFEPMEMHVATWATIRTFSRSKRGENQLNPSALDSEEVRRATETLTQEA